MSNGSFRDRQVAAEYEGTTARCRSCQAMTEHETLCNLGGLCHACYQHYLDPAPERKPPMTLEQKRELLAKLRGLLAPKSDPGRQCADQLRARRERDGKLGSAQRDQLAALEGIGK